MTAAGECGPDELHFGPIQTISGDETGIVIVQCPAPAAKYLMCSRRLELIGSLVDYFPTLDGRFTQVLEGALLLGTSSSILGEIIVVVALRRRIIERNAEYFVSTLSPPNVIKQSAIPKAHS